jgi:hypothetical protein
LAGAAPDDLPEFTERTRPKLSSVMRSINAPAELQSSSIALSAVKAWCSPTEKETADCPQCLDEGADDCETCAGTGTLSLECPVVGCTEDHEDDCCVCSGLGNKPCASCNAGLPDKLREGIAGLSLFDLRLVWSAIAHLEGDLVRVVWGDGTQPLRIYGDGWTVMVMGLRHRPEQFAKAKSNELQLTEVIAQPPMGESSLSPDFSG